MIWEVFRQEKEGDPMRHGGSVMAPDAQLAVHYAREMYGRRQESVRLWVVRRSDVHSPCAGSCRRRHIELSVAPSDEWPSVHAVRDQPRRRARDLFDRDSVVAEHGDETVALGRRGGAGS